MGDVLAFARLAHPVTLDGANQQDGRRAFELDGRLVGVVDLERIVAAERQLLELVVREVLDHVQQLRIRAPEMLAEIRARLDGVFLVLAVDDLPHALDEQAVADLSPAAGPNPCPTGT